MRRNGEENIDNLDLVDFTVECTWANLGGEVMTKFTKGPWRVWGDWAIKDCTKAGNLIATFEHHDQA